MADETSARGEDALGDHHSVDVLGARLAADEDDVLALLRRGLCVVGSEVRATHCRTRGSSESLGDRLRLRGELGVEHLIEVFGRHAHDGLGLRDLPCLLAGAGRFRHVDGHLQCGGAGALADAGLEHPQLALFDGELGVAHVLVVALEPGEDREEFRVDDGELLPHRVKVLGVADARDDVLALRVHQEVAVRLVLAGGSVAGEADTGARVLVTVAEHHCLDVDRRAELVADLLANAVCDGTRAVPAAEHRLDRPSELLCGILRERLAGLLGDDLLVGLAQVLQGGCRDVGIGPGSGLRLRGLERVLEFLPVDPEHDPAVHGDEPAVRVVGEPLVLRRGRKSLHTPVIETEVQDGVHHSRHRELRTGTDRNEKWVPGIAQRSAHLLLEHCDVTLDLFVEALRPTTVHVRPARIGRDGEPMGHGKTENTHHLGEVRTLATEKVLQFHRWAAVLVVECEDVGHGKKSRSGGSRTIPATGGMSLE